ncbi:MAG: DNA-processing protein DprA [Candidatus Krumholzibacteriota bacterium]
MAAHVSPSGGPDQPEKRIEPGHPHWPRLWEEINDPPGEVHVRGSLAVLNEPAIAIVGTRRASARGLAVARALAAELAAHGWVIVSGLALGIDGEAHRGALSVQGRSIGVMATGSDRVYPSAHRALKTKLERDGCTLTEFPPGTPPLKFHFPQRNRLIAGLARGIIVVEAPRKSGAMLTANLAVDYNREVFAVPGPVDLETSRGCHHLLREGAHLVESVADIARVLGRPERSEETEPGLDLPNGDQHSTPKAGSAACWIMDRLDLEGVFRDRLRERWPGTEDAWQEGLLALELAGLIRRLPGGRLARRIWSG